MGIDPDIEYGGNCLACWAPGETPKYLYLNFIGIKTGALWLPGDPPPPNGMFKIEQFAGCLWTGVFDIIGISYGTLAPGTAITNRVIGTALAFDFGDPALCLFAAGNELTEPPARKYTSGTVQVSWKG